MSKTVIVHAEEGKLVASKVVNKIVEEVVKELAKKALEEWDPSSSDFTVIKTTLEVRYKLPIDPNLYERLIELNLEMMREGNDLVVRIPIYTISYDSSWIEDAYHERKIIVLSPYLDDEGKRQLEEYAIETTREPKRLETTPQLQISEEELKRLEEGLREIEEEKPEKPKRTRKRRRRQ